MDFSYLQGKYPNACAALTETYPLLLTSPKGVMTVRDWILFSNDVFQALEGEGVSFETEPFLIERSRDKVVIGWDRTVYFRGESEPIRMPKNDRRHIRAFEIEAAFKLVNEVLSAAARA